MVDYAVSGLRSARIEAGVDPHVLADRIGVHINSYYRFENGTRRIYFDKVCVLADALGVSTDRLRRDPGAPPPAGTIAAALDGWEPE